MNSLSFLPLLVPHVEGWTGVSPTVEVGTGLSTGSSGRLLMTRRFQIYMNEAAKRLIIDRLLQ